MVIILDFGSQYTQLIARRVREVGVYCEIFPYNFPWEKIKEKNPEALILSGGPASVRGKEAPLCDREIFSLPLPVLGICYGMQLMAKVLGGEVKRAKKREYGKALLFVDRKEDLFWELGDSLQVWMSHSDRVNKLPPGFEVIAHTQSSPIASFRDKRRRFYGVQFHPEVVHTPRGKEILKNFLFRIAKAKPNWSMKSFIEETIRRIRKRVGKEKVICALSGGVDSSVLSALLFQAVGKRAICVFVNTGLLRKGEPELVKETFQKHIPLNFVYVDARKRFLEKLKGVMDPEKKRKIIGEEFIRVFEEEARKHGPIRFLAQGTLYPDIIESRSVWGGPTSTIKSHHNVGGLPEKMEFELIEPLKELFKDEVRKVGKELGLPPEIVTRHPFPGPGLGVRILGEVTPERLEILREADSIVEEEVRKEGLYEALWQAFAVLLPVKTVGVMGDERTYENVVALRVVESLDGMTADWARLPYHLLERISSRIINEVKGVNRVVYDISSKPPSTIEWE